MVKKLWSHIKSFRPPLIPCCIFAVLFSSAALLNVAADFLKNHYPLIIYTIYAFSAIFLSLTVWSAIIFCRHASPKRRFLKLADQNMLTSRMVKDFSFRTVTFTYISFALNILLALAKGIAGWVSGSWWLITLSVYYIILCISKFLLLRDSRKLDMLKDQSRREEKEWRAYRICGIMLLFMTIVLLGIVILITLEGNEFSYYGILIFVVAVYDFYCLITAIVYMLRTRKLHTPIIAAIKTIRFAAALVSMLSLQTAMFASFGSGTEGVYKTFMNISVGLLVCVLLLLTGIIMIIQSTRKIKSCRKIESINE